MAKGCRAFICALLVAPMIHAGMMLRIGRSALASVEYIEGRAWPRETGPINVQNEPGGLQLTYSSPSPYSSHNNQTRSFPADNRSSVASEKAEDLTQRTAHAHDQDAHHNSSHRFAARSA